VSGSVGDSWPVADTLSREASSSPRDLEAQRSDLDRSGRGRTNEIDAGWRTTAARPQILPALRISSGGDGGSALRSRDRRRNGPPADPLPRRPLTDSSTTQHLRRVRPGRSQAPRRRCAPAESLATFAARARRLIMVGRFHHLGLAPSRQPDLERRRPAGRNRVGAVSSLIPDPIASARRGTRPRPSARKLARAPPVRLGGSGSAARAQTTTGSAARDSSDARPH